MKKKKTINISQNIGLKDNDGFEDFEELWSLIFYDDEHKTSKTQIDKSSNQISRKTKNSVFRNHSYIICRSYLKFS